MILIKWALWAVGGFFGLIIVAAVVGSVLPGSPTSWAIGAERDAQARVRDFLRDPSSAEFREVILYMGADRNQAIVCGYVNARNGFGGMAGHELFVILFERNETGPYFVSRPLIGEAVTFAPVPDGGACKHDFARAKRAAFDRQPSRRR